MLKIYWAFYNQKTDFSDTDFTITAMSWIIGTVNNSTQFVLNALVRWQEPIIRILIIIQLKKFPKILFENDCSWSKYFSIKEINALIIQQVIVTDGMKS